MIFEVCGASSSLFVALLQVQYVGSAACKACHPTKFESQSKTGHAHALALAPPGSPGHWAFGAGAKAITYVSQADKEWYVEHGLSYYPPAKSSGPTPGHSDGKDIRFRTFDSAATPLRCFGCHSTGTLRLGPDLGIEPSEPGVHCESCHGPGSPHLKAHGAKGTIRNPKQLKVAELNEFCGSCHRKPPEVGEEDDWSNSWNVRHQPAYLNRAACFRNSGGALSCLTCHDPHTPVSRVASVYDKRCSTCHQAVRHRAAVGARACVDCHMPQVTTSAQLQFTNHWIGIYENGGNLIPARRTVKSLRPVPPVAALKGKFLPPADPSQLRPLFEQALALREKELGPKHAQVARSATDLGLLLKSIGDPVAAEAPLRKALEIDQANAGPLLASDQENLASVLAITGKEKEAIELFKRGSEGQDAGVAARCFSSLAILDAAQAETYYRNALQAEEAASGKDHPRVAMLLNDLALALRQKGDDRSAEPLFRRAVAIEEKALGPNHSSTASMLINLGNLLQGAGHLGEAERMERNALRTFEEKLGPESQQLSTACTNLADVLWSKGDRAPAATLYRRALSIDESIYGAEHPQVAGDLTNLGGLLKEAGDTSADLLLQRALAIFVKAFGPNSQEAGYVREKLQGSRR